MEVQEVSETFGLNSNLARLTASEDVFTFTRRESLKLYNLVVL